MRIFQVFLLILLIAMTCVFSAVSQTRAEVVGGASDEADGASGGTSDRCTGKLCMKCVVTYKDEQNKTATSSLYGDSQKQLKSGCSESSENLKNCQVKSCNCVARCPTKDPVVFSRSSAGGCRSPSECGPGGTCISGRCYNSPTGCNSADDCAPGRRCIAGNCR